MRKRKPVFLVFVTLMFCTFSSCKKEETTTATRKNIEDAVFASGYIEQSDEYTVSASVDGILISIPVSEGDIIPKNKTVATIKSEVQQNQLADAMTIYNDAVVNASANASQLQQIQTKINQAQEHLDSDRINYERYKDLSVKKSVSQIEYEKRELQYKASLNYIKELKDNYKKAASDLKLSEKRSLVQVNTQKAILDDYYLSSSISGTVINVFKKQGELIRRGEAVVKIGSGAFVIKLFVGEEDIKKINLEQIVAIHMNSYPGEIFDAKISKIYPSFNTKEQSYIAEARFGKLPPKIFSGSQLQANIATSSSRSVLVIPSAYLVRESYVLIENGKEIKVETGRKNTEWTEVISGISEETVLVKPKN